MAASTLITLREGLEAALILGIILAYLRRTGNSDRSASIWIGAAAAALLSVVAGGAIFLTAGEFTGRAEELFEGTAMLTAAGVLTYMIFWMRRQSINIRAHLVSQVDSALAAGSPFALGLLAFVAVGREGIETALFMFAAVKTSGAGPATSGGVLGLVLAIVLGYLLYRGTYRMNLRAFFNVTSALLLLFAAGLLAHGIHEFHEAGVIPVIRQLWDINWLLPESSTVGSFLKALFGYNGNPSLIEVLAWTGYLGLLGWVYFRPAGAKELRAQRANA
jgi:high-affinity iron transporter